jgi:hypothetical protein
MFWRRKKETNRLSNLLKELSQSYELPYEIDPDSQSVRIIIQAQDKAIHCQYTFDESEDGYEFVSVLAHLDRGDLDKVTNRLLSSSPPVRGITERVINNKLVVFGSRDRLENLGDREIQLALMDDIARIVGYYENIQKSLEEI